jgi:hypothetical protein
MSADRVFQDARRLEASLLQLNMTDAASVLHNLLEAFTDQESRYEFYSHKFWEDEFDRLRMERERRETG